MAVPNLPFYMTAANTEFVGTAAGWSSATLAAASLPKPRWLSELAGRSASATLTMVVGNHGAEATYGASPNFNNRAFGSITGGTFDGRTITDIVADVNNTSKCYITITGTKFPVLIDFPGYGTISITASGYTNLGNLNWYNYIKGQFNNTIYPVFHY